MKRVALITCYNGKGELLFGRRLDNDKWTLPGGHLDEGEDPRAGIVRELHEETGLHPSSLSYLHEDVLPDGTILYAFSAHVRGEPHGNFDPDHECDEWKFFDITDGIPSKIWNNLHGPDDEHANIIKQVFEWEEAPESPGQKLEKAFISGPNEPTDLHKQPLGYFCPHGLQVFLVNGEHVRDQFDSDFVQGGNPFRYKWIPKHEIWVDNDTPREEIPFVVKHECFESEKMRAGEGYDKAHDEAKAVEDKKRKQDEPAADFQKAQPKVWRSDDWGTAAMEIPSAKHPDRTQYDANYLSAIKEHYGSVTPIKVPITGLTFRNDIKSKPRYDLYRKMVRAGDRLPPAVVRRTSTGFEVLDGNHKGQAARDEGAKHLDAVEVPNELSKAEPLEKMALIHDDHTKPMTVYRVEGPNGQGPYHIDSPVRSTAMANWKPNRGDNPQPGAAVDFTVPEIIDTKLGNYDDPSPYKFAFEKPEHAQEWFGPNRLKTMHAQGYQLKPVQAKRVYRSQTGKQVMYLPHDEGTLGKAEDKTWAGGRCLTFAHEMKRVLGRGARLVDLVEPQDDMKMLVHPGLPHHVMVEHGGFLWDGEGSHTHADALNKWSQRVRAPLRLESHDPKRARELGLKAVRSTMAEAHARSLVNTGPLAKAEDEVLRGLDHPDLNERTLALKLDSVTPRHLQTASLDPHPQVHEAAIAHPRFGNEQVSHLMEATKGTDGAYPLAQQLHMLKQGDRLRGHHLAMLSRNTGAAPAERQRVMDEVVGHPVTPEAVLRGLYLDPETSHEHRQKVLQNLNTPADVLEHALHTGLFVPGAEATQLAKLAAQHPHLAPESRDGLVRMAADRGQPHQREIAMHALANGRVSDETREKIFQDAKLKPGPQTGEMLGALLSGPSSGDDGAYRALQELSPEMYRYTLKAKGLTPHHVSKMVSHAHGNKDQQLLAELAAHPMFGPQHMQQLLSKAEMLMKSVDPKHFKSVVQALDPEAHSLVDHTPDLRAHPPGHGAEVEAYKNHIIEHPYSSAPQRTSENSRGTGITRKKVFKAYVSGKKDPQKFMVKPYHERVIQRVKKWMKFPIQGWAEMTHQALYHAAGIGDLHQKVHVAEHDMGPGHEKEPALVVALHPNAKSMAEGGVYNAHNDDNSVKHPEDYRKIAMMDFLSNNRDRHGGNLMVDQDTLRPLSVDHSRSFQYIEPNTEKRDPGEGDEFKRYHSDSSIDHAQPFDDNADDGKDHYDRSMANLNRYKDTFNWWGTVSDDVKKSFHTRLDQIKDPIVRSHLKRNFDARADWLDERAKFGLENYGVTDWHRHEVPMYLPHQMTDEEKKDPEFVDGHLAAWKRLQLAALNSAWDRKFGR